MKNLIIIVLMAICIACQKSNQKPNSPQAIAPAATNLPTCSAPALMKDIPWKPILTGYIDIMFASSGKYYESAGNEVGTWQYRCADTVRVITPYYYLDYRIVSVTADTLKLENAVHFVNTYHK